MPRWASTRWCLPPLTYSPGSSTEFLASTSSHRSVVSPSTIGPSGTRSPAPTSSRRAPWNTTLEPIGATPVIRTAYGAHGEKRPSRAITQNNAPFSHTPGGAVHFFPLTLKCQGLLGADGNALIYSPSCSTLSPILSMSCRSLGEPLGRSGRQPARTSSRGHRLLRSGPSRAHRLGLF